MGVRSAKSSGRAKDGTTPDAGQGSAAATGGAGAGAGKGAGGQAAGASGQQGARGAVKQSGWKAGAGPPQPGGSGKRKRSKSTTGSIVELVSIVAIAVLLAIGIQAFIVKPYRIPSGSMEPTLAIGQRVLVNRIGMDFGKPHVGEIAVFHPPVNAEHPQCGPNPSTPVNYGGAACDQTNPHEGTVNFIKRIVAGPGDTLSIREGHVYRNGKREQDSYIRACGGVQECNFPTPIKIPPGHWFMMGDNRGQSDDSRFWGPVPTSWIIGDAFATYWPPDRIGLL
jgi:signal peptidase I